MVSALLSSNAPLVRLITPETPEASIVSPSFASASAWRNDPAPLSLVLVTGMIFATADNRRAQAIINQIAGALLRITLSIAQNCATICKCLKVKTSYFCEAGKRNRMRVRAHLRIGLLTPAPGLWSRCGIRTGWRRWCNALGSHLQGQPRWLSSVLTL